MKKQPFTSFAMFGSMRSGSNLLETYLNQYEGLVCHGELFHRFFIGKQGCQEYLSIDREKRDKNPQLLLDAIRDATPEKIAGYRIFQTHNPDVIETALNDPFCAKIILSRDPVESYVSLQIALKTNQWLISDPAHRKAEQITFDIEDFEIYMKERNAFYGHISAALSLSEQPFFEIDYEMLGGVDAINRLAAFIGDRNGKTSLKQPIKRQNPGALSDKILNFKETRDAPGMAEMLEQTPPSLKPIRETGTDLSRVYLSHTHPLAFGPMPAVPDSGIRRWLAFHDSGVTENGYTAHGYTEWRKSHGEPVFFSLVRHPVVRAYNAFMQKIFATTSGAYIGIRQELEDQYGLMLPAGEIKPDQPPRDLVSAGYGADEHRISFKLFLVFVAANLANETKIRQDGKWQHQSEIIRRYQVLFPEVLVFKFEDLSTDLTYLENRLGFKPFIGWKNELDTAYSFALSEIYDQEIEALTQAAYAPDYDEFKYKDLSGF